MRYFKITVLVITILAVSIVSAQSGPGGVGTTDGSSALKFWLKADAGVTKDTTNLVSRWDDQSGNGAFVSAELNKRPTYDEAEFPQFNIR